MNDRERRNDEPEPYVGGPPKWNTEEERWAAVETALEFARRNGEFDNLPGAGKPLKDIEKPRDPDWWIKQKIESEGLTGIAPPVFQLRTEHAEMEQTLDDLPSEARVRDYLDDFNKRVREARRQLHGGPPVVTPLRDIDAEVRAWEQRRIGRAQADAVADEQHPAPRRRRWRWGKPGRGRREA